MARVTLGQAPLSRRGQVLSARFVGWQQALNCCVLPKRQRAAESEPAARAQAKRYKMCLHVSCSAKLVNFNRY